MLKSILTSAVSLFLCGCQSVSNSNVTELGPKSGDGSIVFLTTFVKSSQTFPCKSLALEMQETSSETAKPHVLSFYVDTEEPYVVFNKIPPGTYSIKNVRCNSGHQSVFNGGLNYFEDHVEIKQVIKANKLTLSDYGFSGAEYSDNSFRFSFNSASDNVTLLQILLDEELTKDWDTYIQEPSS
ncbi:hypothetical protein B6A42_06750 [Vibrio coralliilyticus]|nr:hypothetical protein B6A42_06750 [Vibrio coralliilyticus]